jgi:hypothetical protein
MSSLPEPAVWKIRLVGAAAGPVASGLLGVLLYWTVLGPFGLSVGLIGIPCGAITGAIFAPRLARAQSPAGGVAMAAFVACLVCVAAITTVMAVAMALSPYDDWPGLVLLAFAFAVGTLIVGFPVALVAAGLATWWGRRYARHAEQLWIPAAVVLLAMGVVAGLYYLGPVMIRG